MRHNYIQRIGESTVLTNDMMVSTGETSWRQLVEIAKDVLKKNQAGPQDLRWRAGLPWDAGHLAYRAGQPG